MSEIDVSKCKYHFNGYCKAERFFGMNGDCNEFDCYFKQLQQLKQENEKIKAEIKLTKEMLIQNDNSTNWKTIPQIIEEFIDDNLLDAQNKEGYTIPIFYQIENKFEILETAEQKLEKIKEICSDNLNLAYDITGKLKEIKEIIGE